LSLSRIFTLTIDDRLLRSRVACHGLQMDALDISYRLKRLGKTQTQIARDLGVRQGVVSNVIHNRATAHGVATYIADLLEMRVEDLWPERYRFKPRVPARRALLTEANSDGEVP